MQISKFKAGKMVERWGSSDDRRHRRVTPRIEPKHMVLRIRTMCVPGLSPIAWIPFVHPVLGIRSLFSPSAAAQLGISDSFFRESVRKDPKVPVIVDRGMIACNTPAFQQWWHGKRHHK